MKLSKRELVILLTTLGASTVGFGLHAGSSAQLAVGAIVAGAGIALNKLARKVEASKSQAVLRETDNQLEEVVAKGIEEVRIYAKAELAKAGLSTDPVAVDASIRASLEIERSRGKWSEAYEMILEILER